MTGPSLPDSSELTREDFNQPRWKEIVGDAPTTNCRDIEGALHRAFKIALDEGNLPQAKVLRILEGACSMRLTNKSRSEPYEPMGVWNGGSSPTPDWFSESDINFIADILDGIDEPVIKGRLADLVWLRKIPPRGQIRPRGHRQLSLPQPHRGNLGK